MVNQWKDGKRQEENRWSTKKARKDPQKRQPKMNSFCGCLSVNLQSFFFSEAAAGPNNAAPAGMPLSTSPLNKQQKDFKRGTNGSRNSSNKIFVEFHVKDLMPCWQVAWCISCSCRRRSSLALSHNCFSCHVELQCTIQKVKVRRDEASKHDHPQNKKLIGKDRAHEIKLNF